MPINQDVLNLGILGLSENDVVSVRDACEGIFISGAPGSGKSTCVGKQFALGMLSVPNSGALIVTAKSEETLAWLEFARVAGRSVDVIVFNEKSGLVFDPIAYEWNRPGRGAGDIENVIDFFTTLVSLGKKEVGHGHDPFWERGAEQLMRNVIKLLDLAGETISIVTIDRCIKSLPTTIGEFEDADWQQHSYCAELIETVKKRRDSLTEAQWSDLDFATQFIFKKWPAFDDRPRSSLEMTWSGMADKFLFSPFNRIFCSGECTIRPSMTTHEGKIIIVDFPLLEYGFETARLIQVIVKLTFQRAWLRRNLDESGNFVFLWQDEFQYFLTRRDNYFQQTCRGSRVAVVCLTQNILNLAEELGESSPGSKTKAFLGNLGLKIFLQQNDMDTCQFAADQIGKEYRFLEGYNASGSMQQSHAGITGSLQLTHIIEPVAFTRLRKPNSSTAFAEGVVYSSGKLFNATKTNDRPEGRNYLRVAVSTRLRKDLMPHQQASPQNAPTQSFDEYQERALNMAHNISSVVTMPVEIFIRPWYGSQYFSALNPFLSLMLLTIWATVTYVAVGVAQMVPFVRIPAPTGMFSVGSMLVFFFFGNCVHGLRLWRRMIFMDLEEISTLEGRPLPFFLLLPKGESHWICRIFYEPAFVWLLAGMLSMFWVVNAPLLLYLRLAAICLAMKNYVAWYKHWAHLRNLLDTANAAPIVARILSNTASHEDREKVHLATLPENLPPDVHKAAMSRLARAYSLSQEEDDA